MVIPETGGSSSSLGKESKCVALMLNLDFVFGSSYCDEILLNFGGNLEDNVGRTS
jgi:hypothetical protein